MAGNLEELYAQKIRKLSEQKVFSDQMNDILCGKNGLNESSNLMRKNLKAAIAASQKPGCNKY